ncbi:MAG: DUF1801 domain-containing protein [Phycisphaerales bacterium]|nr:MAG: DUF1801 domain-containing protein [Phycisphaerales bacterium]
MISKATTVDQYLAELPPDRREAIQAVRQVILDNLDEGFEEGMQYGMIGYHVPHAIYPDGYHCDPKQPLPFASLASQKNHMALYLFCNYVQEDESAWFQQEWAKTGKKLDMGKSCVRFKKLDDLALDVIGKAIRRMPVRDFIDFYETAIKNAGVKRKAAGSASAQAASRKAAGAAEKKTAKKVGAKKALKKKTPSVAAKKKSTKRPR